MTSSRIPKLLASIVAVLLAVPGSARAGDKDKLTVYGVLDAGLAYQNRTTASAGTADTGQKVGLVAGVVLPMVIGVVGSHELGNSNRIEFQLEGGTNLETGAPGFGMNPVWGRNANFGVAGDWGSVRAGYELTPFLLDIGAVDPQALSQAGSALNFYLAALGVTGMFDDRMVQYRSPDLKGFKASAGFGTGNVPGSASKGRELQATASYAIAGFNAGAGYLNVNDAAGAGRAAESVWAGAGYKLSVLSVKAMFMDARSALGSNHVQLLGAGAGWQITSAIAARYGFYDYRDRKLSANGAQAHTLLGTYAVDPSTTVYLGYTLVNNDGVFQVSPLAATSWGASGAPTSLTTSALYAGAYYTF